MDGSPGPNRPEPTIHHSGKATSSRLFSLMLLILLFSAFVYLSYKRGPTALYHQSGRGPLFFCLFFFGIYTPCYAWPWIFPLPLLHARERQNRRLGCVGPPLFIAGVSLTTLSSPPHEREERKAMATSRNYRDERAVR